MKAFIYLGIITLLTFSCKTQIDTELTVNLTGDVMLAGGVADKISIHGDSILELAIKPFFNADFNIINLETVLTKGSLPSNKVYQFKFDPSIAITLKNSGITHASIANNHSFDFGKAAFNETVATLKKYQILSLGVDIEPIILKKEDQEIGILAASLTSGNNHLIINDNRSLIKRVKVFRQENPELPLVLYLHWGLEYQRKPEQWQKELAELLIDNGADAVIGHHPHVFQSIDYYKDKPIVYSLGNFVADAYLPNTHEGMVATLRFNGLNPILSLKPVNLKSYFPQKMSENEEIAFLSENLRFNSKICYYKTGDNWSAKSIKEISFNENATEWLFHVQNENQLLLRKLNSGSFKMSLINKGEIQKSIALQGGLSEIEIADITNDKSMEILLGITKKVNFDKEENKRLNIFKIEENGIKVVWLGTHFIYNLESFAVNKTDQINYLVNLESDSTKQIYEAIYQWDEFGFGLKQMSKINEKLY